MTHQDVADVKIRVAKDVVPRLGPAKFTQLSDSGEDFRYIVGVCG